METTISIKQLSDLESEKILKDKKISRLKPVSCTQCGETTGFRRKLFQVKGVPQHARSDDDVQNVIRHHLKREASIDFAFLKPIRINVLWILHLAAIVDPLRLHMILLSTLISSLNYQSLQENLNRCF